MSLSALLPVQCGSVGVRGSVWSQRSVVLKPGAQLPMGDFEDIYAESGAQDDAGDFLGGDEKSSATATKDDDIFGAIGTEDGSGAGGGAGDSIVDDDDDDDDGVDISFSDAPSGNNARSTGPTQVGKTNLAAVVSCYLESHLHAQRSEWLLRCAGQSAGVQGMAAAAAAAAAAIAAKPAGQININLGGGGAGGGSGQARANGSQGTAGTQSSGAAQRSVYDFDIEGVEDKPWTKPGASRSHSSVGPYTVSTALD